MKVLCLTHIYPSANEPTRGPYCFNTFYALSQHCEVRVVVPEPWWGRIRRPIDLVKTPREVDTGLDTTLPAFWSIPRAASLHARAMYLTTRRMVRRIKRDFPFDVILTAWGYPDAVAAAMMAEEFNCPFVVNILGSDANELGRVPRLRSQMKRHLSRAYRVVTVSGVLADRMIEVGIPAERVSTLHNAVDGTRFAIRDRSESRAQLGLDEAGRLLCYVGRLGREKGVDVLLKAYRSALDLGLKDVDLLLVGGGDEEAALREYVRVLGIGKRVRFTGMRPHSEIPQWISAADVVCLPSRREGCPNVVLEALASGKPVVATRVGGVPEILSDEFGAIVPSEDPDAMANGILSVLSREWDPESLRGSVGSLSWNYVGERYYEMLVDAVAAHKVRSSDVPAADPVRSSHR